MAIRDNDANKAFREQIRRDEETFEWVKCPHFNNMIRGDYTHETLSAALTTCITMLGEALIENKPHIVSRATILQRARRHLNITGDVQGVADWLKNFYEVSML